MGRSWTTSGLAGSNLGQQKAELEDESKTSVELVIDPDIKAVCRIVDVLATASHPFFSL